MRLFFSLLSWQYQGVEKPYRKSDYPVRRKIAGSERFPVASHLFVLVIIPGTRYRIILYTRIRDYFLTVKNIDIPPEFIVLRVIAGITHRDPEIKRIIFLKGIDGMNCRFENLYVLIVLQYRML